MASRGSQRQIIDSCSVMTISGGRRNISAYSTVKGGGVGNDGKIPRGVGTFWRKHKETGRRSAGDFGVKGTTVSQHEACSWHLPGAD